MLNGGACKLYVSRTNWKDYPSDPKEVGNFTVLALFFHLHLYICETIKDRAIISQSLAILAS